MISVRNKDELIVVTIEGREAALTMEQAGKLEDQLHKARRDALEAAIKVRKARREEQALQREAQRGARARQQRIERRLQLKEH